MFILKQLRSNKCSMFCQINKSMFWGIGHLTVCAGVLSDVNKFWFPNIELLGILVTYLLTTWVRWLVDCDQMLWCRVDSFSHHGHILKSSCFHNLGAAAVAWYWNRAWVLQIDFWSSRFPLRRPRRIESNISRNVGNTLYLFEAGNPKYWDVEQIEQTV